MLGRWSFTDTKCCTSQKQEILICKLMTLLNDLCGGVFRKKVKILCVSQIRVSMIVHDIDRGKVAGVVSEIGSSRNVSMYIPFTSF